MTEIQVRMLPIGDLIPTPDNPRKVSDKDPATRELAESIRQVGILQNLIARPHPEIARKFDLRVGHRRLVAARLAGLAEVPVVVRELMDDAEALDLTIAENLHRADPHYLEEARCVELLAERRGYDGKAIATHLGMTERWVRERRALANLHPDWKAVLTKGGDGDSFGDWGPGQALLIARLPHGQQRAWLKELRRSWICDTVPTIGALAAHLNRQVRTLAAMPWDIDDTTLVPKAGACSACPKRSAHEPLLFEDGELAVGNRKISGDRCLDAACYDGKQVAFVQVRVARAQEAVGDRPIRVLYPERAETGAIERLKKALGVEEFASEYELDRAKKTDPGAMPCVAVDGPKGGQVVWMKRRGRASRTSDSAGGGGGETAAQVRERRRFNRALELAAWSIRNRPGDFEIANCGDAVGFLMAWFVDARPWDSLLDVLPEYVKDCKKGDGADLLPAIRETMAVTLADQVDKLRRGMLRTAADRKKALPVIEAACRLVKETSWKEFTAQALEEIPEPAKRPAAKETAKPAAKKSAKKSEKKSKGGKSKRGPTRRCIRCGVVQPLKAFNGTETICVVCNRGESARVKKAALTEG